MEKNSLKYTLREILIVIIGITIAFSMNKCADNIKDKRLRKEYLINLKSDISADKERLTQNLQAIDNKIEICNQMIPLLNSGSKENLQLLRMVFKILEYENFNPKNITYNTLVNSGDLKLISDFGLKKSIQRHYSNYNIVDNAYQKHQSLIRDYLGNYMINYADYDEIGNGKSPFLDETKLKNIVRALLTTFNENREATQEGIDSCDQLLSVLDSL